MWRSVRLFFPCAPLDGVALIEPVEKQRVAMKILVWVDACSRATWALALVDGTASTMVEIPVESGDERVMSYLDVSVDWHQHLV